MAKQDSTYFFDVNFGGVSYTDLDLRKFKKRGLKQVAEIELQMVQTAGMFQFNSGVRSPFQDDTANEAKFKNWANRVQDCISVNELYMIGREIELETKVEFNSIVFSRDQVFDDDSDNGAKYKGIKISDEDLDNYNLNNYTDDFDF